MDAIPDGDVFNDPDYGGIPYMDPDAPWSDYWTVLGENRSANAEMVSQSGRTTVLVFGAILIVWSICLHAVLLWILGRKAGYPYSAKKHRPLHWLLSSLSAGQVLVALLVIPVEMTTEQLGGWTLGPALCQWWRPAHIALVSLYFWGHLAVTVERYLRCVRAPSFYRETDATRDRWFTGMGVFGVWLVAFCCALVVTLVMRTQHALIDDVCAIDMSMETAFVLAFAIYFVPASLTITASATLVFVRLRGNRPSSTPPAFDPYHCYTPGYTPDLGRRLAKANEAFGSATSVLTHDSALAPPPRCDTPMSQQSHADVLLVSSELDYEGRELRSSLRVVLVANVVAVACWAPFYVTSLLVPFCRRTVCIDPTLWTLFLWLGYASLGLSPIVWYFEPSIRAKAKSVIG